MKKLLLLFTLLISITCLGQTPCDSLPKIEQPDQTICVGDSVGLNVTPFGNSLEFDGVDDYVQFNIDTDISNDYAIEGWVKVPPNTIGSGYTPVIFAKSDSITTNSSPKGYMLNVANGKLNFFYRNTNGGAPNGVLSTSSIDDNNWHHIAISRLSGTLFMYIDGVIEAQVAYSDNITFPTGTKSFMGRWWNGSNGYHWSYYYNGLIANLSIWDISLALPQIQQYMSCPPLGNEAGLVGYWNFKEGTGTITADKTSNGNDGTLINGVTWSTDLPNIACYSTYDYTWSTGDTTTSITVSPSATTTYSVTVDDGISSCTDSVTVTVSDPQVNLGDTLSTCGDSVLLDAGSGYNYYSWSTGESTQTIYATATGDYAATVGDTVGVDNDYSLEFDGVDDYVSLGDITLDSDFSFETWVYIDPSADVSYSDAGAHIFSIGAYNNGTWASFSFGVSDVTLGVTQPTIICEVGDPSSNQFNASGTSFPLGQWVHIGVSFNAGQLNVYQNGTNVLNVNTGISQPNSIANNVYIGARGTSWGNTVYHFDGLIERITYWDNVLSQQDFQNYMNCPPTGTEAGLVGYWDFEEGTGTTANDLTSNGNDGTINSATWSTNVPSQTCVSCSATDSVYVNLVKADIEQDEPTICIGDSVDLSVEELYGFSLGSPISGFTYGGYFNGSYYYVSNSNMEWIEADSLANGMGGMLCVINTQNELQYLVDSLGYLFTPGSQTNGAQEGAWIGLLNGQWLGGQTGISNYCSHYDSNGVYGMLNLADIGSSNPCIGDEDASWFDVVALVEFSLNQSILWSTGDTTASITVSPTTTTNYTVSVSDGISSCTDSVTVTVSDPQVNLGDTLSACGDSVLLDAGAGYNYYSWSTGENTQTIYATATGDYAATVGDSVGVDNDYSLRLNTVNDYMEFTNKPIPATWSEGSLTTWVKFNGNNWGTGGDWIFSGHTSTSDDMGLGIHTTAHFINQYLRFGFYISNTWEFATSNIVPNIGQWYYIVGTWGANGIQIYIDGVLSGSNSYTGASPYSDDFSLGRFTNTTNQSIIGDISSFGIWNTALDSLQILHYMNCPPTGNEAGLVGYWGFEEGTGTTTSDQTGNGNDGTITGATWSTEVPEQVCVSCTATDSVYVSLLDADIEQDEPTICLGDSIVLEIDPFCSSIPGFNLVGNWGGSCYYVYNDTLNWTAANAVCVAAGGNMIAINSQQESDYINLILDNTNTPCCGPNFHWLGLVDGSSNWTNGAPLTFTNYDVSYNSGSNPYMYIQTNGFWDNASNSGAIQSNGSGIYPLMEIGQNTISSLVWSTGDTTTSITVSPSATTTYSVAVSDGISTCSDSVTVTVSDPAIAFTTTDATCNGYADGTAAATSTNGVAPYSYTWSTTATTSAINSLGPGTYSVSVTDSIGCTSTDSTTIGEPALLTASGLATDVLCYGDSNGSIDLTVSGGTAPYSFLWIPSSDTTEDVGNLGFGVYSYMVTDINICLASGNILVDQPLPLQATDTTTDISCTGGTDGTASVTVSGGTGPYSVDWGGLDSNAMPAGTHTYTVTDDNGCTYTDSAVVGKPTVLQHSVTTTDVLCNGDTNGTATLDTTGGTPPYTVDWQGNDPAALPAGTFDVIVTDDNGCDTTLSYTVNEPGALNLDTSLTHTSCSGFSDGSIALTVSGGTGAYGYSWSTGDTTAAVSGLGAGTYSVTVTDDNGCTDSITAALNDPALFAVSISGDGALCQGDSTVLTADNGDTFSWFTGESTQSITFYPSADTLAWVTAMEGPCTADDTLALTVYPLPVVYAGADTTIDHGTTITLGSNAVGTYFWYPADGLSCTSCESPDASPETDITYYLEVTDSNGCVALDSITVTVNFETDPFVANIFSPNGDGLNDVLHVNGLTGEDFNFRIYDRWGNILFETSDASTGWDGTANGKVVNSGEYVYTYSFKDNNGNTIKGHGSVTLVK